VIKPLRSYTFGEFELDLSEETLRQNGEKLNINHRMFQVLRLLIEMRGEIVSKGEFFEKVWDGSFVEDNNLTVTIRALRKVLGDDAKKATFIENVPRKGYRFVADVRGFDGVNGNRTEITNANGRNGAFRSPPNPGTVHLPITEAEPKGRARSWSGKLAIGILTVTAVAVLAIAAVNRDVLWPSSGPHARKIVSVAVLPFENRTVDSEYLADGLTDSITSNLSKQPGLRVIDRNSAYNYKNKVSDALTAGRELNVQAVVTGQIEQNGDVLIINAELIDLAHNTAIWRQQFRRQVSDIFATQHDISQAIAQNLQPGATGWQKGELSKRPTNDPIAYDLYLRGRYLWNKRTNTDIEKSAEFFRAAIDKDPTFAKAYVGLADTYTLGDFTNLTTEEKNALVRGYVQKALEIDSALGEAYAARAINECYFDWDLAGAESDYRRAVELSPNDATAHHWYAEFLSMQGRFEESFAEYDRAMSLDPLSLPIKTDMAFSHYYARDYNTAIELLNKVKESNPEYALTYEFLKSAYRENGMFNESVDASEKLIELKTRSGDWPSESYQRQMRNLANLRSGVKKAGGPGFWRANLEIAMAAGPLDAAATYSKLGESDKAFEYLEKAFNARLSGMVWLKVTPEFDGIRSDPRYQELLRRVGF